MGVPSFLRWLINKCPRVVVKATEDRDECDNFYIDMDSSIYPCLLPDDDNNGVRPHVFSLFTSCIQFNNS